MNTKRKIIVLGILLAVALLLTLLSYFLIPVMDYNKALDYIESGKYEQAKKLFTELGDYKDSREYADKIYYAYDKETTLRDGKVVSVTEYTYDENGKILKKKNALTREITEYLYNENGDCVKSITEKYGQLVCYWIWEYDECGNNTKKYKVEDGQITCSYEWEYDENGNKTKEYNSIDGGTPFIYEWEYDEYGNMIKLYEGGKDEGCLWFEWEYDNKGNQIKETRFTSYGTVSSVIKWSYNDKGQKIKEVYNVSGEPDWTIEGKPVWTKEWTYDQNGNMLKEVQTNYDGSVSFQEYTYDSRGNVLTEVFGDTKYEYVYEGEHIFYKG